MNTAESLAGCFDEAAAVLQAFRSSRAAMEGMERFTEVAATCLEKGGKLLSCGNGGSMCDAMHFAEEWTGRFRKNRRALPAVAFSDPGMLSCIGNDFGYDQIFARYLEALGRPGDVLVAISTSGNSPNVLNAVEVARSMEITSVGLLGKGGGPMLERVDVPILVPLATNSDRIQEIHIKVIHGVIEAVERRLVPENYAD